MSFLASSPQVSMILSDCTHEKRVGVSSGFSSTHLTMGKSVWVPWVERDVPLGKVASSLGPSTGQHSLPSASFQATVHGFSSSFITLFARLTW